MYTLRQWIVRWVHPILYGAFLFIYGLSPQTTIAASPGAGEEDATLFLPIIANGAGVERSTPAKSSLPLEAAAAGALVYYHYDATDNLMALSNESGEAVWRADVRPFGQATATSSDYPLRFAGQPQEADGGDGGGLYHLGARYYDPITGRFLSADPLALAAVKRENPQRFNQYSYALNNPYRYQDTSGLQAVSWEEQQARIALRNFVNFVERELGPTPSFADRVAAFNYGPFVPPDEVLETNNQPIRSRAGQEVDLDWGARLAGVAVANALDSLNLYNPTLLEVQAKQEARKIYYPAKGFWNAVDWVGEQLGGKRQTGPLRADDPNILGVDLLIDYIVYGGELRDYFDPVQAPPRPAQP
jgi:RHS repeat-associated protein